MVLNHTTFKSTKMHKKTKRPKSDKKVQIDKHAKTVTRSLKVEKARNILINSMLLCFGD